LPDVVAMWLAPIARTLAILAAALVRVHLAQTFAELDFNELCPHEKYPHVSSTIEVLEGETVYREIGFNETHRYFHQNYNITKMWEPDNIRRMIVNLEPCWGVVYLFVRKATRCYPDPYSCVDLTVPQAERDPANCQWTHFVSEINGDRDGAPTFFEIPLTATKYYLSVYALEPASYTLTILPDLGAFPRPGMNNLGVLGEIRTRQTGELSIQLSWDEAFYFPQGVTETEQYWVYSAMLPDEDNFTVKQAFLKPDKIMNTVCGIKNNTDRHYEVMSASLCNYGMCNTTVYGVLSDKRYVFNVIVESKRGFMMAYAGTVIRTRWGERRQEADDATLRTVGAMSGSVLGVVAVVFLVVLQFFGERPFKSQAQN